MWFDGRQLLTHRRDDDCPFRRIVAHSPWLNVLRPKLFNAHNADVGTASEVPHADGLVPDVEKGVVRESESGSFSFEFKDDETVVVT